MILPFSFVHRVLHFIFCVRAGVLMLFLVASSGFASEGEVGPADGVWDLGDLFASVDDWGKAREEVLDRIPELTVFEGRLDEGAERLLAFLELRTELYAKAGYVYQYASLMADEDLRVVDTQERKQLARQLYLQIGQKTSWFDPELVALDGETVESYLVEEPGLAPYALELHDLLRSAPYTLSPESEQILALARQPLSGGNDFYRALGTAEIPWPEIEIEGENVRLDSQGYTTWRRSPDRELRKRVFDLHWGKWAAYERSIGEAMANHVQAQVFYAKARGYPSVLERELFDDNLPRAVYDTLIEQVNAGLPTLHRYLRLRGRMLGIEDLRYYDTYPTLVSWDHEYTLEDAKRLTLEAMSVFGPEWVDRQGAAMSQAWMHVYPQPGKRSGAYQSGGPYDSHPYLLLNFDGSFDAVSTFAHEWGHAMHTLYAKSAQDEQNWHYATFIAEIPSTTFELLLRENLFAQAQTDDERLFYLGDTLEAMRGTFFRQAMFAEFELAIYEAAERGEALSGRRMSELYGELLRRYQGHADGVVEVDEAYFREWMGIPHFYRNMYVFQYATAITAGAALYDAIRSEGQPAIDRFVTLLKDGGSDYPYNLLRKAGVDLATSAPYDAFLARMNTVMDEMEAILDRREGR